MFLLITVLGIVLNPNHIMFMKESSGDCLVYMTGERIVRFDNHHCANVKLAIEVEMEKKF